MKNIKFILAAGIIALLSLSNNGYSQNWGFSLPFGGGGFAINKKNWVAGFNGATVGGGNSGWGFQLPNGAGFYNGSPMGGAPCYGGGYGGGAVITAVPQVAQYGGWRNGYGWNYGAYPPPTVPGYGRINPTTPVRVFQTWRNGAAVYQSANGQVWVRQRF